MFEQLAQSLTNLPGGAILWSIFIFVVVIGVLVFIHEMGHYLAARSVGVFAEVFSIGFGPEIYGWDDKQGTRWKISILPLGGYVQMYGMTGEVRPEDIPDARQHEAFVLKSVLRRMWVVFAGPLANFVLALFLLSAMFYIVGEQKILANVGDVTEDMPAKAAGLQADDEIIAVNNQDVHYWHDMAKVIEQSGGGTLALEVYRPDTDETLQLSLQPKEVEVTNILGETSTTYHIGIQAAKQFERKSHGLLGAIKLGAEKTYQQTTLILQAVWRMISGQMKADIGGPITIGKVAGEQASIGLESLLMFMAFISINLGLINLFPVPILDGGHLLYFAIEGLMGKPLSEKAQEIFNRIGLTLIILLMVFAFYKDIKNVIMPHF